MLDAAARSQSRHTGFTSEKKRERERERVCVCVLEEESEGWLFEASMPGV